MGEGADENAARVEVAKLQIAVIAKQKRHAGENEQRRNAMKHAAVHGELADHRADTKPDEQVQAYRDNDDRVAAELQRLEAVD